MKDFFDLLLRFFEGFNGRRALVLVFILFLFVGGFIVYDRYTASFTFGRLDHAADLIVKLQTIEANPAKRTPELEAAYQSLRSQVAEAVATRPVTVALPSLADSGSTSHILKFVAGVFPWLLCSFFMVPRMLRGDRTGLGGFVFFGLVAVLFGLLALLVPAFWWPWGNLIRL